MLNSLNSIIVVIGTVIGIIVGLLAIFLFFRKRQFASPKLQLRFGLFDDSKAGIPKKYRKPLPSIMVIIPEKPTPHPFIAYLFLRLKNRGKEALKNVRLVLEYKKQYLLDNELLKSIAQSGPTLIKSQNKPNSVILLHPQFNDEELSKGLERREVANLGGVAQISCEIPIIRPGEEIVFYDLLLLQGHGPDDFQDLDYGGGGFQSILPHLREIKSLKDYFVVSILAFAENQEKIHSRLSVLRFSSGANRDEALESFRKALWFKGRPRAGIYFSDGLAVWILRKLNYVGRLSRDIFKNELGIITYPEVALIRTKKKQAFAVEVPEISQAQYFSISTPNCDYYTLPNHVNNFETLWAWLGMPAKPFKSHHPKREEKSDI